MKSYNPHQKFKRKRSLIALVVVIALAAVFVAAGITLALVERNEPLPEVTGMEFLSDKLGAYADFDNIFVKVAFSDGKTENVPLSQLLPTGIDKEKDGYQNIALSYGDKQFTIRVNVVTSNMTLRYVTSGEGGSIVGETEQTVAAGSDGSEVEATPSEGYEFDYWSDNAGKGAVRKDTNVLADAEYRAVFKKKEFKVAFLFADGTDIEQTVKYGERATPIPDTDSRLKKYGYRFDGWDTDEWKYVTKNVTIRPKMTQISAAYDVYVSAQKDEPMGVKSITDTNVETDSLNGLNVSQGMDAASGYYLYKGYYQWELPGEIKFTTGTGRKFVRFEVYGAEAAGGIPAFNKVYPDSDVSLWIAGASEATRFVSNGDGAFPALSFTPPENSELVTIRAVFAEAVSTISFFARGSVQWTADLPFGEKLTAEQLRSPGDREGADFDGWYDDRNVKIGTNHEPFYTNATLNAQYVPKKISVRFEDGNGSLLKSASADYDFTIKNDDFAVVPAKNHYRSDGWIVTESDDPTLVGTVFNAETRLKSNMTVVPNYQRIVFDATFQKIGQGRIFYTETDGSAGSMEIELTERSLSVKSGASYGFRFEGAGGYAYRGYKIVPLEGGESSGITEKVEFSDLRGGFFLQVTFEREEHNVSIENGSTATGVGSVTILETVYEAESFAMTVLDGMPLELKITAPKDMRIDGIYLLDSSSTPGDNLLPDGVFDGYTYHYAENEGVVKGDVAIRITYAVKTFTLRPSVAAGGGVRYYYRADDGFKEVVNGAAGISIDLSGAMTVPYGTDLKGAIAADAGKYVSNLTLYGKSVDFYQYYYESYSDALYASGDPYFFTDRVQKGYRTKDPRVSAIAFYLPSPNGDVEVSAAFDDVYYEVSASASGFGKASFEVGRVKEGESVALTMTTEESYVVTGYELTTYGAETQTVKKPIGDNASSMRETIADVRADLSVVVLFGRRTYSVLFYSFAESGVSFRVESDGAVGTVDNNRTVSDVIRHGDGRTYLLTAVDGYEFREIRLVDGHGDLFLDGGNPRPGTIFNLPVNTDRYELVLNSVTEAYGVIVTLERKNYEVVVATNAVSETIGTISFAANSAEAKYVPGGAAFSYRYGTEVTVKAIAGQTQGDEFRVSYFSVGGTVYPLRAGEISAEATFTVTGATGVEVLFAYAGTKTGVVVDPNVQEPTHAEKGQHGYVTYRLAGASAASAALKNAAATDSAQVVEYRAFAEEGYVLKGLYVNGEKLDDRGFGVYSAALNENSFHYVSAIFEKRALKLTLTAENGALKAEKDYVLYGENATVWFVPNTGYELTSLKKNGKNLTSEELAKVKTDGFLNLLASDTVGATETVSVGAVFSPIAYKLYGTFDSAATGMGKVVLENGAEASESAEFEVFYGRRMTFRFVAADGSYLAAIYLNGVAVDLSTLESSVKKTSNGKYASGQFDLVVTGETRIVVRFDKDVFKVTVADAPGGATTLSQSASGNDEYSSDEAITISMKAFSGYHIEALYVNGTEIPLNFASVDDPNLNTSILYLMPGELLQRNLTVRAEYVRNVYGVKITVRNDSPNFKTTDDISDNFLDKLALEYGGKELSGVSENDRANSRLTVSYDGIEHAGSPSVTIQPKLSSGYYLKNVTITFVDRNGTLQTVDYTAYFNESSRYAMTMPALYGDVTEFLVSVARKSVTARIPSEYRTDVGRIAIRVRPVFYAGSEIAQAQAREGDLYTYEFGVRVVLDIALEEGFTATLFKLKTGEATRDFLSELDFRSGHASFSTTLTDEAEFTYAAEVTRITLTLDKIGAGSGTFNFLIEGSTTASVREITVDYGANVAVSVVAERARGSYIAAIRINGQRQELGAGDAGVHYEAYLGGKAVKNAAYEVELSILEYRFTMTETEGVQGYSFNNDTVSVFPWGTARVNVRIELRLGYKLVSLSVNGAMLSEGVDYTVDGSVVTFRIDNVASHQKIDPEVRKMTFTAANSAASGGVANDTTIYRVESDGRLTRVENNKRNNVAYGDRLIYEFRPAKNYFVDEYAIEMEDLNGVVSTVLGTESFPEADNSDVIRIDLGLVTGDVSAEIKYSQKLYVVSYADSVGAAGVGKVTIGSYQIPGGDSTVVAIQTKNLRSPDGKVVYYGLSSLKVNGCEYFMREVSFDGWGERLQATYDNVSETYEFRYRLDASDALMNGAAGIVGSGRDFSLKLEIKIEKNLYSADRIVVRNLETTPAEEKAYPVGGGTFTTDYFTGQFFETILDGASNLVGLEMIEGYSPKSVNVIVTQSGEEVEKTVQSFGENAGSQKVFVTAGASIADMSDPYRKMIRFVIEVDRNRYETGFSVLTYEQNGEETTVGTNVRGVRATLAGEATTDEALTKISHGAAVVLLAGEQIEYDFAGFERYDEISSKWVAAENVVENGKTIVLIEGRELTVSVVRQCRFRAVYYKKVKVDVVVAPWHKYISGMYASGSGDGVRYVVYASVKMTVSGAEKRFEVEPEKNAKGIFRYVFRYGDEALLEASDTRPDANPSQGVKFYYQNGGAETLESGEASGVEYLFRAESDHVYADTLTANDALYVAFDNNIKLNASTETLGGKDAGDGGTFGYEQKSFGSYTYSPLTFAGKTANVKMFDRIRITVGVNVGYRFESFSRYKDRNDRSEANLSFDAVETFARYVANFDDWNVETEGEGLESDPRVSVKTESQSGERKLVVEFTVVDNSIYRFDFVKVYDVTGFVSAPRYLGDTENAVPPVSVTVAEGNKSYFLSDANGVQGKLDYGAKIEMSVAFRENDPLKDVSKWQFVSWYANGVSGFLDKSYFDGYADMKEFVLNERYVSSEKSATTFSFYAEFLPIYSIATREYFKIGDVTFQPANSFKMSSRFYDPSSGSAEIPRSDESVKIGEMLTTRKYLPFDARKNSSGDPVSEADVNPVRFSVSAANSYMITEWRVYFGNYNAEIPDFTVGETFAGNTMNPEFQMTRAMYEKLVAEGDASEKTITIVPVFHKQNSVNISRFVFYNGYGEPNPSGSGLLENQPKIEIEGRLETIDGERVVSYGDSVNLVADPHPDYRFIGWFPPSEPLSSTSPVRENENFSFVAEKTDNADYTYSYEARYIRTVTLTVETVNNSGIYVANAAAEILKGDFNESGWMYNGTNVTSGDPLKLKTIEADNAGRNATIRADVGSYALLKLSNIEKDTFQPTYDVFYDCVATADGKSVDANYTATQENSGDPWKLVAYLDQTKTITVRYQTYGEVTMTGLLDGSKVTFGKKLSKNLYDYTKLVTERVAGVGVEVTESHLMNRFYGTEVESVTYANGILTALMKTTNTTGTIRISGVKKDNYGPDEKSEADVLSFRFQGFQSDKAIFTEPFKLNFSGDDGAARTKTVELLSMPFAGGGGTSERPYQISNLEQFQNIDTMYGYNDNSLYNIYFIQTAEELTLSKWRPMCSEGNGFNGHLDGGGKIICVPSSLESATMNDYGGIFAKTSLGSIRQYKFKMAAAVETLELSHQNGNSGVVSGVANGAVFSDLQFEALTVKSGNRSFGLVAGTAADGSATGIVVTNLKLNYSGDDVGSVFGIATGSITIQKVEIRRDANNENGGSSEAMFQNTSTGGNRIGGIVGSLRGSSASLKDSRLYGGVVRAAGMVGGAVGYLSEGATVSGVHAILEKTVRIGSSDVAQTLQVAADNVVKAGSTSLTPNPNPSSENDAAQYSAGGIVGYAAKSSIDDCSVRSDIQNEYSTVSVLGSVAGGIVGVNGLGATVSKCYIESDAAVEILMPSRTDSATEGSDGIFGGIVGSNIGTIHHCGINGTSGTDAFTNDTNVGGSVTNETFSGIQMSTSPFESEIQKGANVEFLYAAYTNINGLKKDTRNNFYYGANFYKAHGPGNGNYYGSEYAARGTSTTVMGGVAGCNASRTGVVISCYVLGKVSHFRRLKTDTKGMTYAILGGIVGYNYNIVYGSGIVDAAIYNYVKPVTEDNKVSVTVSAGGVVGQSAYNYLRGNFAHNAAIRAVNDPWAESAGHAGAGSGSVFYAISAAILSTASANSAMNAYCSYAKSVHVSATSDAINTNGTGEYHRLAAVGGINYTYTSASDLGGFAYGNVLGAGDSNTLAGLIGATILGEIPGSDYFKDSSPVLLASDASSTGEKLTCLGLKSNVTISLA